MNGNYFLPKVFIPIIFLLSFLTITVIAEEAVATAPNETFIVSHAAINEDSLTIVSPSKLSDSSLFLSISNNEVTAESHGLLSDENAVILTTILIDTSTSIPYEHRESVLALLSSLIEKKPVNEYFTIIAFDNTSEVLIPSTSDRYELATSLDKIIFDGAGSAIYDALYKTLNEDTVHQDKVVHQRTIILTDGVDDTATGITKEELLLALQNRVSTIDIIAVSSNTETQNKELAALVRAGSGSYHNVNSTTDIELLSGNLDVSTYSYLTAKIPHILLDGTTRQTDIFIGDQSVYQMDIKYPTFNGVEIAVGKNESTSSEIAISSQVVSTNSSSPVLSEIDPLYLAISASILLLIIIFIIIILQKRKKRSTAEPVRRVPVNSSSASLDDDITVSYHEPTPGSLPYDIHLVCADDGSRNWSLKLANTLLIGRAEKCDVRLLDKSVSREHCKILSGVNGPVIINLSKQNIALLNGMPLDSAQKINHDDIITLGRERLRITYLSAPDDTVALFNSEHNSSDTSSKTESVF